MGKRHQRERARIASEVARSDIREAEESRLQTERRLEMEEQYLGSPAQVAGGLGVSSAEIPYLGQYSLDEDLMAQLEAGRYSAGPIGSTRSAGAGLLHPFDKDIILDRDVITDPGKSIAK